MNVKRLNIAIASPGDVSQEREAILRVCNRWNGRHDDVVLHPEMWEYKSVPTMGDSPQSILNKAIIEKSDLLIAILWTKLGTPTPTASSGTVEEIREFILAKGPRRAMLYFCTRDIPYDADALSLVKLKDFKKEIQSQGLYHEYKSVSDFERDVYSHLEAKVNEVLTGQLPLPEKRQSVTEESTKHAQPDERLRTLINFGVTLPEIAKNFQDRMAKFNAIGAGQDKFLDFGAHVYLSVAFGLDQFLTYSATSLDLPQRRVVESISARLKRLAMEKSDHINRFTEFWNEGSKIADDLKAHVKFLDSIGKIAIRT
ncbi:hypothetical protein NA78x_006167 [Anatilimnocola sp. NA78]|uniref:hypothetical protein n=1 Tax=Anatilimnocola sp. NA78 TaxID=3415683 RepID=UPI003CE52570